MYPPRRIGRLRIENTSFHFFCWGIKPHSWCSILGKSTGLVRWVICLLMARPRMSRRCSMQAKSGDIGGRSILATLFCLKKSPTIRALIGLALSYWKTEFPPICRRYGMTWRRRISSMYRRLFRIPGTIYKVSLAVGADARQDHYTAAIVCCHGWTFGSRCFSPLRCQTRIRQAKPWLVRKKDLRPLQSVPSNVAPTKLLS